MRESDNWESSIIIITKIIITIIIMAQISICSWLRICPQVISCQDDPQHELASFSEETKAKSTSAQKRFLFSKTLMRIRISRSTLRSKFQFLTLSRSPRLNERHSQTHPEILFKFLTKKRGKLKDVQLWIPNIKFLRDCLSRSSIDCLYRLKARNWKKERNSHSCLETQDSKNRIQIRKNYFKNGSLLYYITIIMKWPNIDK